MKNTKTNKLAKHVGNNLEELGSLLRKMGFRYLDEGCSREVWVNRKSRRVIKIGERGANRTEWFFYQALPKRLKSLFAKPIQISKDGSVIEMEFVDTVLSDVYGTSATRVEDLIDRCLRKFKLASLVCDTHCGNVGITKSREVKIIDYGYLGEPYEPRSKTKIKRSLKRLAIPKGNATLKLTKREHAKILSST